MIKLVQVRPPTKAFKLEGTATITADNTSVTVTHNKNTTPKYVFPTDELAEFAGNWWLENITANAFDIVVPSAAYNNHIFRYGV